MPPYIMQKEAERNADSGNYPEDTPDCQSIRQTSKSFKYFGIRSGEQMTIIKLPMDEFLLKTIARVITIYYFLPVTQTCPFFVIHARIQIIIITVKS